MYMCKYYICTYIYLYIYVCVYVYVCIYIHTYMQMHIHNVHMYVYIRIYIDIHIFISECFLYSIHQRVDFWKFITIQCRRSRLICLDSLSLYIYMYACKFPEVSLPLILLNIPHKIASELAFEKFQSANAVEAGQVAWTVYLYVC